MGRRARFAHGVAATTALLLTLTGPGLQAQQFVGEVVAGSTGNEVDISVATRQRGLAAGVVIEPAGASAIATNVAIVVKPPTDGNTMVFTVSFDVPKSAPVGATETLKFRIVTDELLLYDSSSLHFSFRVVALDRDICWVMDEPGIVHRSPQQEDMTLCDVVGSCADAARYAEREGYLMDEECTTVSSPTLYLTEIRGPSDAPTGFAGRPVYIEGAAGYETYSEREWAGAFSRTRVSHGFTQLPTEIQLGSAFTFTVESRVQRHNDPGSCVEDSKYPGTAGWGEGDVSFGLRLTIRDWIKFRADDKIENGLPCVDKRHPGYEVGGTASLTVRCVPDVSKTSGNDAKGAYFYLCDPFSNISTQVNTREIGFRENSIVDVVFGKLTLIYRGEPGGKTFEPHRHAFEVNQSIGGQPVAGPPPDSTHPDPADSGTAVSGLPGGALVGGATAAGNTTGGAASAAQPEIPPVSPGTSPSMEMPIEPDNPDIAALINEWLSAAEPPPNATEGSDFRYVVYGQLEGTSADGGVATPGRPDAGAGMTSVEYVWSVRTQLDSVDHCTVGEYVEARLAGNNIGWCRDRYKPRVPDMHGWRMADAQFWLGRLRLGTLIRDGGPAPGADLEGTVERQGVAAETSVERGSTIEVWVYTAHSGGAGESVAAQADTGWGGTIVDRKPRQQTAPETPCPVSERDFALALRRADLALADSSVERWLDAIIPLAKAGCVRPALSERFAQAAQLEQNANRDRDRRVAEATRSHRDSLQQSIPGIYSDPDDGRTDDWISVVNGIVNLAIGARAIREGLPVPPQATVIQSSGDGSWVVNLPDITPAPLPAPDPAQALERQRQQAETERFIDEFVRATNIPNAAPIIRPQEHDPQGPWIVTANCSGTQYSGLAFSVSRDAQTGGYKGTFSGSGPLPSLVIRDGRITFVRNLDGNPNWPQTWTGTISGSRIDDGHVSSANGSCSWTAHHR